MTYDEIDRLIGQIKEMARRIGCDFVPDPDKLEAFRRSQLWARATKEQYRAALRR